MTRQSFEGDLCVRFNQPHMCYGVDGRAEMISMVRQLLSDKAVFVATFAGTSGPAQRFLDRAFLPSSDAVRPAE